MKQCIARPDILGSMRSKGRGGGGGIFTGKEDNALYKNLDDIPLVFGPQELAKILGISRSKAYELVNQSDFPRYRYGRRIIIQKDHFIKWLNEHMVDTENQKTKR